METETGSLSRPFLVYLQKFIRLWWSVGFIGHAAASSSVSDSDVLSYAALTPAFPDELRPLTLPCAVDKGHPACCFCVESNRVCVRQSPNAPREAQHDYSGFIRRHWGGQVEVRLSKVSKLVEATSAMFSIYLEVCLRSLHYIIKSSRKYIV